MSTRVTRKRAAAIITKETTEVLAPSKRRKAAAAPPTGSDVDKEVIDLTAETEAPGPKKATKAPKKRASPQKKKQQPQQQQQEPKEEKRLRRFREHAPESFVQRMVRAMSQRMFVLDRSRNETDNGPEELVSIAGTTGNIYQVRIGREPSCSCPDYYKSRQCKHIIYVICRVLNVTGHLRYQLSYLSSELRDIFEKAPLPTAEAEEETSSEENSFRKPIEDHCPVCFTDFEPEKEAIVWCRAGCGNNLHKTCFEQWAKSQPGKEVRCVYCRTPWAGDMDSVEKIKGIKALAVRGADGYLNVGAALGVSSIRDTSTYHSDRRFDDNWLEDARDDYGL